MNINDLTTKTQKDLFVMARQMNVTGVTSKTKKADLVDAIMATLTPDVPADLFVDGHEYTASMLAAALNLEAKDLRIKLRAMGLNVGKGHRYLFTADEARDVAGRLNQEV